jgi:hypothetical protein
MRKSFQNIEIPSLLFGLNDRSVNFRNTWRFFLGAIVWVALSSFAISLTILTLSARTLPNVTVIAGLSFIKYGALLLVVYTLAKKMAAHYLDDIYELHNEKLSSDFLEEVIFGDGSEKIIINEGKITEKDERSPLILIGGPGSIQVNLDSVALVEKVNGEPKVIYPQSESWKLGRFERIREIGKHDEVGKREYAIINLRDQFVTGLSVKSRTKDGIPIEAQGIKIIFSLLRRQEKEAQKAQGDVYLFDEQAVQSLVYNQTIITPESSIKSGITFPWDSTVIPLVISEFEGLITSRTLSEILATVSQLEVDHASSDDQTIAQLRVEITGQKTLVGEKKESPAPRFESRSKITAQFFEKAFKEKAAKLGVSIEWIDIGTWQLPHNLVLDRHKEAWELSQKNARRRSDVERSGKRYETQEVVRLVNSVIIESYLYNEKLREKEEKEKETEELEKSLLDRQPQRKNFVHHEASKRDDLEDNTVIALDMLNAFRRELLAGREKIESDTRSDEEKQEELAKINKALYDINFLTSHWLKNTS